MSPDTLRDQIMQLAPAERLQLVEDIWDSLTASPSTVRCPIGTVRNWNAGCPIRTSRPRSAGTRFAERIGRSRGS